MAITLGQWKHMLDVTADLLLDNANELSKIDAVIGDGDHGITIAKIAHLMKEKVKCDYESTAKLFDDLGWDAINVQGGSAGPLFGTFFSGFQNASPGAGAAEYGECALKELQTLSTAKVGEKTMMDALIPAVEAMKDAKTDEEAFTLAAEAARKGAERTCDYIAKFGRAKNYGERSIGVKDAGACSMALIFEGFQKGYQA